MLAMSATPALAPAVARALGSLTADLEQLFGTRLVSLVLYGRHVPEPADDARGVAATAASDADAAATHSPIHTLALVTSLAYADLAAGAARVEAWDRLNLATPLLLSPEEFASSLDVFPLEYGAIIARHLALVGDDPFRGIAVRPDDVRRACEVQAKSHVIHLREGFLQTAGDGTKVARLIAHSVPSFHTILTHLTQLDRVDASTVDALARHATVRIGLSSSLVSRLLTLGHRAPLSADEAMQLYPPYLDASEALAHFVDGWKETARA